MLPFMNAGQATFCTLQCVSCNVIHLVVKQCKPCVMAEWMGRWTLALEYSRNRISSQPTQVVHEVHSVCNSWTTRLDVAVRDLVAKPDKQRQQ